MITDSSSEVENAHGDHYNECMDMIAGDLFNKHQKLITNVQPPNRSGSDARKSVKDLKSIILNKFYATR